jgi:uncharacterized protein (DUF924 family)
MLIRTFFTICFLFSSLNAYDLVNKQDGILSFWFGPIKQDGTWSDYYAKRWFSSDPEFDDQIKLLFERDVENAALGRFQDWKECPKGRLALILLLDQFPRNLYRGTARAFAYDKRALALCLEGIELGQDKKLAPIQQQFFYMPLMHAEEKAIQDKSIEIFQTLSIRVPFKQKEYFENTLRFATLHHHIVQQFGRFPHRNSILGRTSTQEEQEYLNESNQSFGQG